MSLWLFKLEPIPIFVFLIGKSHLGVQILDAQTEFPCYSHNVVIHSILSDSCNLYSFITLSKVIYNSIQINSNVPKVFVKFVDATLQMRCVTNFKHAQHRLYLAKIVEISYVVILMLYINPSKVMYLNVITVAIYQYGMQTWMAATWTEVWDAKYLLMYI